MYDLLIMEDDDDIREELTFLLESEGFRVQACANGQEGLNWLLADERHRPRLILLDYMMPCLDGAQFRERQLAQPALAKLPVVLISAHGAIREAARRIGVQDYFPKPLRFDHFLDFVRQRVSAP